MHFVVLARKIVIYSDYKIYWGLEFQGTLSCDGKRVIYDLPVLVIILSNQVAGYYLFSVYYLVNGQHGIESDKEVFACYSTGHCAVQ